MQDKGESLEKMCNENTNKKKCYIGISRFQEKEQYQKQRHLQMIKMSIQQEGLAILCAPNNRASKYMKQRTESNTRTSRQTHNYSHRFQYNFLNN